MKSLPGCLIGVLLGIVLSVLVFAGYTIFNSVGLLPLAPASNVSDPDITITMKEQYLNDQARKAVAARGMNVTDLSLSLHAPNRADATMTMPLTVLGQSLTVRPRASLHFGLTNGLVTFDIDKVDVAGFVVPQDLVNQQIGNFKRISEDQLNAELKRSLANSGLHVVGIECTEGALILKLSR